MTSTGRDDELEALLFECLERLEVEGFSALEELCAAHPSRAAALRDSIGALQGAGMVLGVGDGEFPERLGEYRLLRRIGGGGMGVVFLAEQPALGRDVAVKLVRPDQLYFPNARERFQREIEAIARLAHPGIVRVHSLGEDKGIPFYAMEYVPGISLAHVIAAFHGRRPETLKGLDLHRLVAQHSVTTDTPSDLFRGAWSEVAVRIALQVARAIEHAHERGVLHRDLKPSNIMLTPAGRVVLIDFGLASLMGAERLTRTGSQLGSLPYMAPEQIRGDVAAIGAGADVYALGVTLYELLALRPAFQDDTNSEALRRDILEGRVAAVGQAHRGLSRDLTTVVAHAMAPEVGRRYPTARALADDLDALLVLRPITARPPTATDRATSWARRNPARAMATALGATLLFGGPLLFGWQQYRANERVRATNIELQLALERVVQERNATEVQRAAAERNLRGAIAAVDTMLTRVGQDTLRDVPQMTTVRRSLLEDALTFYEGFLAEQGGDREMRREVILARMRVASVRASMGETADVERELTAVITEVQTLLTGPDAHEDLVLVLARALGTRGEASARLGRLVEARESVQAAIEVLGRVPVDHHNAAYYTELAAHHDKLYDIAQRGGDLADALVNARRAVELSREGLARFPDNVSLELGLGRQLDHVGGALLRSGEAEESLELMLESVRTLERYHLARPADVQGREKLMAARINTANTLNTLGRYDEAEPQNLAGVLLGEALVKEFPDVPSYRSGYALALNQSCQYAFLRRDYTQAATVLKRALDQQEVLAVGRPADIGLRAEMAVAYGNLSAVQLQLGEREASLESADRGLESVERALARVATQDQWLHVRRSLWNNRGMSLVALGRWREAVEMARTIERDLDHGWLWRRAQLLERSARLAELDTSIQERAAEAASLRDEALADLTLAVERGLTDWSELAEPDHWASLREDPRFLALVKPPDSAR